MRQAWILVGLAPICAVACAYSPNLIVEADDKVALARGLQRLLSRATFTVNRLTGRTGKLWRDRYHRHDLKTPTAVRNAYVYVLFNHRKHAAIGSDLMVMLERLGSEQSASMADAMLVSLESMLERDPTIGALADLPLGGCAMRESADMPWQRTQEPREE